MVPVIGAEQQGDLLLTEPWEGTTGTTQLQPLETQSTLLEFWHKPLT